MEIAVFSAKPYDRASFEAANAEHGHGLDFLEARLDLETSILARGRAVCCFVNDRLDAAVLEELAREGTRVVALRCAGFNHVDLAAAARLGLTVTRVPAYSPHAVAEHAMAMILTLNRKIHRAWARVREGNFSLEGLLGFDMHRKTVGVVGTGRIGKAMVSICRGFGCRILARDVREDPEVVAMGAEYVPGERLLEESDILTLHCPLTPETHHLVNARIVERMKPGVMLINTSRGALVDTAAVLEGLKSRRIGALGLDVYEEEEALFFRDLSAEGIPDDLLARLTTFPNVLVTGHQAFLTREALHGIATTTLGNVTAFELGERSGNELP